MEKCSNFINNINILFDVIRISQTQLLTGRSCPKNFILIRGLHHSQETDQERAGRDGKAKTSRKTSTEENRLKKPFNRKYGGFEEHSPP